MPESPCDGSRGGAILSGPSAPGRSRETSSGLGRGPGARRPVSSESAVERARGPRLTPTTPVVNAIASTANRYAGSHRTNGREAGLASRPGRTPGLPVAGQLRDVAARHAARRRRRAAVPDRGPEWLREGLARDPLPIADQPDAGPDRRLQRPGRVHRRRRRAAATAEAEERRGRRGRPRGRRRAAASRASTSGSSRPGSAARAARPT